MAQEGGLYAHSAYIHTNRLQLTDVRSLYKQHLGEAMLSVVHSLSPNQRSRVQAPAGVWFEYQDVTPITRIYGTKLLM